MLKVEGGRLRLSMLPELDVPCAEMATLSDWNVEIVGHSLG